VRGFHTQRFTRNCDGCRKVDLRKASFEVFERNSDISDQLSGIESAQVQAGISDFEAGVRDQISGCASASRLVRLLIIRVWRCRLARGCWRSC
jgi:hypothetical protein